MTEERTSDRRIEIQHDALGSAIVSGDGNKVVVYHYHLAQALQGSPLATAQSVGANPYRGLAAFQVEDAAVYFGREVQVDRLWNRLRDIQERMSSVKTRLLPILGASGSGKSSLARAGLLPELARRSLPGYRQAQVAVMTPGVTPLESLSVVLARIATQDLTPVEKAQEFERVLRQVDDQNSHNFSSSHHGLRRIANALPGIEASPLIVLVDQFEEVYSLCKDPSERTAFIENLLDAASSPTGSVSVVITLRSDFLGEIQQHPKLDQLIGSDQSVIVPAMTTEELRRAIAEPAKQAGCPLHPALVELLIKDTEKREGALPLLQFALTRIWKELAAGREPMETLQELGGIGGALAKEAQRIYDNLSLDDQKTTRRVFWGLVQLGDVIKYTRRRTAVNSLVSHQDTLEHVRQVIGRFATPSIRLITLSTINDVEIAEITHEALFEHWQELRNLLEENCHFLAWRERFQVAVHQWEISDYDEESLSRGVSLDEAEKWLNQHPDDLNSKEQAFIQFSQRARKKTQIRSLAFWLATPLMIVITGAGLFWFNDIQERPKRELLSLSPNDQNSKPHLLPTANSLLPEAQKLVKQGEIDEAFRYYRQVVTYALSLRAKVKKIPLDQHVAPDCSAKLEDEIDQTFCQAENELAQLIKSERLPQLRVELGTKPLDPGRRNSDVQDNDFDKLFTPGALKTTYFILRRSSGAWADVDDNGQISTFKEADRLPCQTLKDIQELWREFTGGRCGWYDKSGYRTYTSPDCTELGGATLTAQIFNYGRDDEAAVERLNQCKVSPMILNPNDQR